MNNNEKLNNTISKIIEFCEFIDKCTDNNNSINLFIFLNKCQIYISNLYAMICSLPNYETEFVSKTRELPGEIKNERLQRFYFVSDKIKNILGENDLYWNVFNPHNLEDDDPSQSRLSNDIGEIYDDLMRNIDKFKNFDLTVEEKLDGLKLSLTIHWHDHACKALTAISWLLYNKIDWQVYK